MLEQHGRSYPIIPGDAAKQWTACDPGQISALRVCPEKKEFFEGMALFFFLLLTYFCENLTRNKPLQHHCYTVLIQERAALCSFTEPENSPKVIAI